MDSLQKQLNILLDLQKELFKKYTGIDVSDIKVYLVDNVEDKYQSDILGKTFIDENNNICVKLKTEGQLKTDFTNFLTVWHEFVHCIDLEEYFYLNNLEYKYQNVSREFTIWTEFSAFYYSEKIYIKFLMDNNKICIEDIINKINLFVKYEKERLIKIYNDAENETAYSFLYSYMLFYGTYLALIEYVEDDKFDIYPKEFLFDFRLFDLQRFLYENKNIPKENWDKLKKIIDSFLIS